MNTSYQDALYQKNDKTYNILMLQLIFIFIATLSLPKQNKLSKNCDSNNNNSNKSKSFLMGLLNLKVIKRYKNDSLFAYR